MRSISSALQSAQESTSSTPYVWIFLTSADGGTQYNYSDRLIQLEHTEEPYNDSATIILYDNDGGIGDLLGYWLQIGYGYNCTPYGGGAQEYSETPRLWVKAQHTISREGDLFMVLFCEGMWTALQELDLITKGEPPAFRGVYEDISVYDIIEDILASVEFGDDAFSLEALATDDGIMDTFKPKLWLNESPFEPPAEVLYRLIAMTKSYLRAKPDLAFEVIYPQEADSADEIYYSNKPYYFYEYREITNTNVPNKIVVYANAGQDEEWSSIITAESEDAVSIAQYHTVTAHHIAADIDNQTDADNRASAIMSKIRGETLAGRLIIPHDCRVELYDKVAVYDARKEA